MFRDAASRFSSVPPQPVAFEAWPQVRGARGLPVGESFFNSIRLECNGPMLNVVERRRRENVNRVGEGLRRLAELAKK
jgi:hypothetical protein